MFFFYNLVLIIAIKLSCRACSFWCLFSTCKLMSSPSCRDALTKDDVKVYGAVLENPSDVYPNASKWYECVSKQLSARLVASLLTTDFFFMALISCSITYLHPVMWFLCGSGWLDLNVLSASSFWVFCFENDYFFWFLRLTLAVSLAKLLEWGSLLKQLRLPLPLLLKRRRFAFRLFIYVF